ncbi:fungal-specific transcription factor domain-containing protein [Bisporella sp. PMI_857]|nr:fungal-specific transcription factor domain-containing protein [Bisporella sp. PMI_857]
MLRHAATATDNSPKKPCHTCRRRRVKCDLHTPQCQKCAAAGLKCLGYGKLILWVQGVASRGKMMGKSLNATSSKPADSQAAQLTALSPRVLNGAFDNIPGYILDVETSFNENILPYTLLDPWLQQLDPGARYYMTHFLTNVTNDLVVYSLPSQTWNPLLLLLEFAQTSSALFHIIISMSAHHLYNLVASTSYAHKYHTDSLRWKAKALRLMNTDLSGICPSNYTMLLTSSMLFSDFALLESGYDTWRIHLDAATRLVKLRISSSSVATDASSDEEFVFRSWIMARIVLQDIFGSTLSGAAVKWDLQSLIGTVPELYSALKCAEVDHYLSCPLKIAQLIASASSLRNNGDADVCCLVSHECLLQSIHSFDPADWAFTLQRSTPVDDFMERFHVGSAYKAAAALYVSRILPSKHSCKHSCSYSEFQPLNLVFDILQHVSQISCDSALFKSTIWPCYIAGAEATNPNDRLKVVLHLRTISRLIPWQTTISAEEALNAVWRRVDYLPTDSSQGRRNWLEEFQDLGIFIFPA